MAIASANQLPSMVGIFTAPKGKLLISIDTLVMMPEKIVLGFVLDVLVFKLIHIYIN